MWNLLFAVVDSSLHHELTFKQNIHSTKLIARRKARMSVVQPVVGVTGMAAATKFIANLKSSYSQSKVVPMDALEPGKRGVSIVSDSDAGATPQASVSVMEEKAGGDEQQVGVDAYAMVEHENAVEHEDVVEDVDAHTGRSTCAERAKECCLRGSCPLCFRAVTNPVFEWFFLVVILINSIIIVVSVHFPTEECEDNKSVANQVFLFLLFFLFPLNAWTLGAIKLGF